MTPRSPQELAALLRGTDIAALELRGPGGVRLRVVNDRPAPAPPAGLHAITAASPGLLLLTHPLHTQPLCSPGQPLRPGDPVALLRVGELLLPVVAPQAATFLRYRAVAGAVLGWGSPVADVLFTPTSGPVRR